MTIALEICPRCGGPISPVMRNCTRGCGYEASPLTLAPLSGSSLTIPSCVPAWDTLRPDQSIVDLSMHIQKSAAAHVERVAAAMDPPARVLVVDFPWPFGDKLPGGGRGAEKHYKVLTLDEIKAFPLPLLTDNCVGFFWRVEALGKLCYEAVEALGFVPKSKITWIKAKPCTDCEGRGWRRHILATLPGGVDHVIQNWCAACSGRGSLPQMGMGHYTRRSTEDCIIAIRKGAKKASACHPDLHNVLDYFEEQIDFEAPRTFHSSKPDRFYEIVEALYPGGPYCELFARRRRAGWQQHGDELPPEVAP